MNPQTRLRFRVIAIVILAILGLGNAQAQIDDTAYGVNALAVNAGNYNSAFGFYAMPSNTIGNFNSALGAVALFSNTSGNGNTALGDAALYSNSNGNYNSAVGAYALDFNNGGSGNTATGYEAMYSNISGFQNTATGAGSLYSNTDGYNGTAFGFEALFSNLHGTYNNAAGFKTLYSNTTGSYNNGMGTSSLYSNQTGNGNTAVGYGALYQSTGDNNISIGYIAGYNLTFGSDNIYFNNEGVASESGVLRIGNQVSTTFYGPLTAVFIGGIYGQNITSGTSVVVDSSGHLGVVSSSRRYKEDIQPMGDASTRLLNLRPVTFRYKKPNDNGAKPLQYGLIAEEVAEVFPELVVYNKDGQPETVAYQVLASLLVNELQRAHALNEAHTDQLAAQAAQLDELRQQFTEVMELNRTMQVALMKLQAKDSQVAMR